MRPQAEGVKRARRDAENTRSMGTRSRGEPVLDPGRRTAGLDSEHRQDDRWDAFGRIGAHGSWITDLGEWDHRRRSLG